MNKVRVSALFAVVSLFQVSIQAFAAPAAASPEIQDLQAKVDLEKQRNTLQAELLANQKVLIDAQKGSLDAQASLLVSQKALLDGMFPQTSGGKTGAITFDASTNIGPLAQPGAVAALNTLAETICKDIHYAAGKSIVIATDADLKLISQARWMNLQLSGLKEAYKELKIVEPKGNVPNALPPGVALYGLGAALKEVASFAQLFRTDTTLYNATVKVDQDSLNAAIAGCLLAPPKPGETTAKVYLPKTLVLNPLTNPDTSGVLDSLKILRSQRADADSTLNGLIGKSDDTSKRLVARITALNTAMDAVISSLFATSDKSPEPLFVSVLAGEAIQKHISDGGLILHTVLTNAAASGIKRTSIWRSDRLYSWASVTINYSLFDSSGTVLSAGTVQNSPEVRKIEVAP